MLLFLLVGSLPMSLSFHGDTLRFTARGAYSSAERWGPSLRWLQLSHPRCRKPVCAGRRLAQRLRRRPGNVGPGSCSSGNHFSQLGSAFHRPPPIEATARRPSAHNSCSGFYGSRRSGCSK
ncbi:unnamed protein product, partial [Polarella glacialis]